jgi:predicted enzyme related to lactoylglutathione lyase
MMEPMDVMGEGHMAIVQDPTGAAFGLWQPGRHTGADAVDQPGTVTWVELATDDLESARRFYGELFGWGWERQDSGDMEYWLAALDGRAFAGLMPKPTEMAQMPNNWATYLGVTDLEATAAEVRAAGGQVVFGPMRMGPGMGIGIVDPQGGYFVAFRFDEWPAD